MNSYKLAKYNIKSSLKSIIIFYCIFIAVLFITINSTGISISGIEFSSMIFLFVMGLNFFKENFYFSQANNIPRTDYFKSLVITILPIALGMSIIDVTLNRIYNIFGVGPTMYDMAYGDFPRFYDYADAWIQNNSIQTLVGTVIFLFAFYILAFAIGLLITMIFYKCNKTMKILIFLSPIAIQAIWGSVIYNFPEFGEKPGNFIDNILGISTRNSYICAITFIFLFIIIMCFVYIIIRRVVVKKA
ncbi:hypothetical protein KTC96_05270 [Clostridium estertheticum]|uniref:hypothetical protein n=1 Tax=Clostridium estertheticum TaxID=238834 RepID=UPI001C7CB3DB|nr:hypothetical protein [Clostridium estertheticum]MBX4260635.1 hypothetical protein [Clostridium estertheticum]WLC71432.1 hypothetical protein KTC96_05270 [Clostridium estertheticum]